MIKVSLKSRSPLSRKIKKLASKALDEGIYNGLYQTGLWTQGEARRNIRAQKLIKTGTLWRSIALSSGAGRRSIRVGTNVPYARVHEYGGPISKTSSRGKRFVANYRKRPYLEPTADALRKGKFAQIMKEEVAKKFNSA